MTSLRRIVADLVDLQKDPLPGVFVHVSEEDVYNVHIVLVGPDGTPYEGGFHFFHLHFTNRYPFEPPSVRYLTTDGRVRMNPNLYEDGRVCLSILGTWEGPGWTSVMNMRSLVLSLQSILGEWPLRNEPGFTKEPHDSVRCRNYNTIVSHYNRTLAISKALDSPPNHFFDSVIKEYVRIEKKDTYMNVLQTATDELDNSKALITSNYGLRLTSEDRRRGVDMLRASLLRTFQEEEEETSSSSCEEISIT